MLAKGNDLCRSKKVIVKSPISEIQNQATTGTFQVINCTSSERVSIKTIEATCKASKQKNIMPAKTRRGVIADVFMMPGQYSS